MSKKPAEKLAAKRQALVERTALALGVDTAIATELLQVGRQQSLRINPLKGEASETLAELAKLGWHGEPVKWCANGFTVDSPLEPIRDSALVSDGRVFIQNAASWLPVLALDPQPGDAILDMCAAPGGKTSHIAAVTTNQARIVANDNSHPRLNKMMSLFARLGVSNVVTSLRDATQLARSYNEPAFDRILLDAPCSGEGMMHLDREKDFASWSVAHIKRLQQLQKRLIVQAWQLLKPGGRLVYSTCTMAPEENEAVVDFLLRTRPEVTVVPLNISLTNRMKTVGEWNGKRFDSRIKNATRLQPSPTIEAFFVCTIQKPLA